MNPSSHPSGAAVKPWYTQSWPWFLIALPATAVIAGVITLWLAIRSDDGLVRADYYKEGLAINAVLAREKLAASMALAARVRVTDPRTLELVLGSPKEITLPQRIRLTLVHPLRVGRDRELVLDGTAGTFLARVGTLEAGRWQLQIEDEARSWRLAGSMRFPEDSEANIGASARP